MNIDQVICPDCNGKKYFAFKQNSQFKSRLLCSRCAGKGTVEWLEIIFNRQRLYANNWEIYERVNNSDPIVCQELVL